MTSPENLPATAMVELRDSAQKACVLLKTMANADRLVLLCHLLEAERNVGELEQLTGIRQPTLSQQLGVLRDEGVVETRRDGKYVYYALASEQAVQVMQSLHQAFCATPRVRSASQK